MYKYEMKDNKDYREGIDSNKPHGVVLIKRDLEGDEWAYGEFKTIDEDMIELSTEETEMITKIISEQL